MISPISTPALVGLLKTLDAAFDKRGVKDALTRAEVYRNGLRGLDESSIRAAVNLAIEQDTYYPKVARLRELATAWARARNRFAPPDLLESGYCPGCRTFARPVTRQRPRLDPQNRVYVAAGGDRGVVELEDYVRDRCLCSGPPLYPTERPITVADLLPIGRSVVVRVAPEAP